MGSILTISIGLGLIGWALVIWAAASGKVRIAELRAEAAEQAARDAEARTDKAIELWNDERAEHTRDVEAFTAQLEVSRELLTTLRDQIAAIVRRAHALEADDDATPPRVM